MRLKVSEIPPDGFRLEITENPKDIESLGDDVRVVGRVTGELAVRKAGTTVYLKGDVIADIELDCSRCGRSFIYRSSSELELDLNPISSLPKEEERELTSGDLEVEFYKGDIIEINELLREQLLLQVPMKPLCRSDCAGVCLKCGKDLADGDCGCKPETGHPGLAGLKELLINKEKEGNKNG